jgi:starch synthase
VISARAEGLELLLLHAPHLYDRAGGIYQDEDGQDWDDNHLRFGALSFVGAKLALEGISDWRADIVHAHDWQAGLVAAYMHQNANKGTRKRTAKKTKDNSHQAAKHRPPSVLTIHNIAFQGLFDGEIRKKLGLWEELFTPEGVEYYGKVGFLKAGIGLSDKITTVSPTYAQELMWPEFGMGLEGLLQSRRADLTGILNGIDLDIWDPQSDKLIAANYSARKMSGKKKNRQQIEKRFGLAKKGNGPLFCVISRLTTQKGLDLLLEAIPQLVGHGGKLALLGSGEKWLEKGFVEAANRNKGSVGVIIGYDEPLSHLMQAGSDAILIPSRFEPCGLTQLYGLRYGTLPVVARTGGLADTVIDANEAALAMNCATGVQFSPVTTGALVQAIIKTCNLYKDTKTWKKMITRAMQQQVSWDRSADTYSKLYLDLAQTGNTNKK